MKNFTARIVAMILIPCLVSASIDPVGAGFHPRPQSEFHFIQSIQIAGRHGSLPLQVFTSQALAPRPSFEPETPVIEARHLASDIARSPAPPAEERATDALGEDAETDKSAQPTQAIDPKARLTEFLAKVLNVPLPDVEVTLKDLQLTPDEWRAADIHRTNLLDAKVKAQFQEKWSRRPLEALGYLMRGIWTPLAVNSRRYVVIDTFPKGVEGRLPDDLMEQPIYAIPGTKAQKSFQAEWGFFRMRTSGCLSRLPIHPEA